MHQGKQRITNSCTYMKKINKMNITTIIQELKRCSYTIKYLILDRKQNKGDSSKKSRMITKDSINLLVKRLFMGNTENKFSKCLSSISNKHI